MAFLLYLYYILDLEYYAFAIFFFVYWCGLWFVHLLAIVYGKWKLHSKETKTQASDVPYSGVSVLKPLLGVDPNLFVNLETFFTMNYPKYELLFCVETDNDPAIMIVKRLMGKYPDVKSSLFTGGSTIGVNPKINNMHPGYQAAQHEFVLISDSGIRMKDDTLLDMMNHMKDNVALVHQLPFVCDREGFAGTYEKVSFGTFQARIYLAADVLGVTCHTGMSSLIRKSALDDVGGLKQFACYLAEDFFVAKALTDRGWKITISSQPAWQNSGICDISSFQSRLTRWAKLRVAMLPSTIILEPLSECVFIGICASWATSVLFEWDAVAFFLIHSLVWFLLDWLLLTVIQNGPLGFSKFDFVIAWIFREYSSPYLFLNALTDPAIRWRSRIFKLNWGGVARELKSRMKY